MEREGWVLRIVENWTGQASALAGWYIKAYDPSPSDRPRSQHYMEVTQSLEQAKLYPTFQAAVDDYLRVDSRNPVWEEDGTPRRPLTTLRCNVEFVRFMATGVSGIH